ncbi:transporter substrate-binding domain-containing protein [Microbacterium sp. ASV49]|uniref:Transporter substrate-binding domain-containing protein n=1 Tax=Microbacterium candidum TaxID=3041922 RepID=A0ABT7MV59_9MICO|nr:transporter substrate-binding domain-containing protein [Microbacterium sp. ASV49]MDL9978340.1 transporter substrate-binding domain-containing protein [Microbacterium sp. ASV49]
MRSTALVRMPLVAVLTGMVVLAAAGCGAQSLSDAGAKNAAPAAAASPVPSDEQAKSVIESVKADKTLTSQLSDAMRTEGIKWTTSVGYPPMEEWGANGKEVIGVDAAIAQAITRRLGTGMSIQDQEFNSMIPGLISGRYDALISSMTDNAERQKTTTFVDYVKAGNAFLVKAGNPEGVSVPNDLCGKTVAVVASGSSAALADQYSANCTAAGKAAYDTLKFEGDSEANLAVQSGRAVATITDYPVAEDRAADPANNMAAVKIDGDESLWGIGIDNAHKDFATLVQKALQSLMDDGTYGKILAAYHVNGMAIDSASLNGGGK